MAEDNQTDVEGQQEPGQHAPTTKDVNDAKPKTFTQEEVDRIINERLGRERGRKSDYEELISLVHRIYNEYPKQAHSTYGNHGYKRRHKRFPHATHAAREHIAYAVYGLEQADADKSHRGELGHRSLTCKDRILWSTITSNSCIHWII